MSLIKCQPKIYGNSTSYLSAFTNSLVNIDTPWFKNDTQVTKRFQIIACKTNTKDFDEK